LPEYWLSYPELDLESFRTFGRARTPELAVGGCEGAGGDGGLVDGGDVGDAVAVGVGDLEQAGQLDVGAGLLAGFPDCCGGG
jgi:hypothetical protein